MAAETKMVIVKMPNGATFKVNPRDIDAWLKERGGEVIGGMETKADVQSAHSAEASAQPKPKRAAKKADE